VTNATTTVFQWISDNFKLLVAALAAVVVYLVANAATLGITPQEVVLLGIVPVVLAVTDPNRDHVAPAQEGPLTPAQQAIRVEQAPPVVPAPEPPAA
jgi:hypothetical protein